MSTSSSSSSSAPPPPPSRAIISPKDHASFQASLTHKELLLFVKLVGEDIKHNFGKTPSSPAPARAGGGHSASASDRPPPLSFRHPSPQILSSFLAHLNPRWIREHAPPIFQPRAAAAAAAAAAPPSREPGQPPVPVRISGAAPPPSNGQRSRFGDKAFRSWCDRMCAVGIGVMDVVITGEEDVDVDDVASERVGASEEGGKEGGGGGDGGASTEGIGEASSPSGLSPSRADLVGRRLVDLPLPSKSASTAAPSAFKSVCKSRYSLELATYLASSFGHPVRLDYGTGHECSFLILLFCLWKLNLLPPPNLPRSSSEAAAAAADCPPSSPHDRSSNLPLHPLHRTLGLSVLTMFNSYLSATRELQSSYNLEPAGSHGVWGLDDFHCLPFYFGAAQLVGYQRNVLDEPSYFDRDAILRRTTLDEDDGQQGKGEGKYPDAGGGGGGGGGGRRFCDSCARYVEDSLPDYIKAPSARAATAAGDVDALSESLSRNASLELSLGFSDERDFALNSPSVSRTCQPSSSKFGGKDASMRKDHAWILSASTICEFVGGRGANDGDGDGEAKPPAPPTELPHQRRAPCIVPCSYPLMYLTAINNVKSLKCTSAPFHEASPMLSDISYLPSWDKVASGLLKLWEGEVVGKRVVVQHLTFGEVFRKSWTVDGTDSREETASTLNRGVRGAGESSFLGTGTSGSSKTAVVNNRDECLSPWGNLMQSADAMVDPTGRAPWASPDFAVGAKAPWARGGGEVQQDQLRVCRWGG